MGIDLQWIRRSFPDVTDLVPLNPGGQKWVFSGKHPVDGDVVLKVVRPNIDPERVRREILATQKVDHPNVPRICEVGTKPSDLGNCIWIREELVSGECLRLVLSRGPLSPREVLKLGREVLEVLDVAATASLVHRDIKPENIIRDLNGKFWTIDFGLARHLDLASLTADLDAWGNGTCGYSAPEQMRNMKTQIDQRSDLFAVAVTLYESAIGQNPFVHGTNNQLERLRRAEEDPLPALEIALPNGSSHNLRDLISAMAQKRRDHRPQSVRTALDWISEICKIEGVL